jgi:hypothetical protein
VAKLDWKEVRVTEAHPAGTVDARLAYRVFAQVIHPLLSC